MLDILPESLHFVGIGGIGMSGLAQMAASLGCDVSGSDRALNSPENARIIDSLRAQGIKLLPQDGSRYKNGQPGAIVYSTAIEEDNPDFLNSDKNTPRIHRSEAMSLCIGKLKAKTSYSISGTCGKTSVSAWMAEALHNLGKNPGFISGGLVNAFSSKKTAGNYTKGSGEYFVIEADESDKSLLNYTSDASMVLNIGTDHYSKEELASVFRKFLKQTGRIGVIEDKAFEAVGTEGLEHLEMLLFSTDKNAPSSIKGRKVIRLDSYRAGNDGVFASFDGLKEIRLQAPGFYNAANALAVYTGLLSLGFDSKSAREAVTGFRGVWRRFDYAGKTTSGAAVYDDYAHNVEKIISCLNAAKEICSGRLMALFQPHGFGPLGFMREELFAGMEKTLRKGDVFAFLPVYYAGGRTSFKPTSDEVADEYRKKAAAPENYRSFKDRKEAESFISAECSSGDVIMVMGARDNSLSTWAASICAK